MGQKVMVLYLDDAGSCKRFTRAKLRQCFELSDTEEQEQQEKRAAGGGGGGGVGE